MEKRIISASRSSLRSYFQQVLRYKSVIITLARRDLKAQYAQTALGLFWSVVQPLTGLLIFTFFFGQVIKVDTGGIPYPLFALSGMLGWYYFTYIVNHAGTSILNSQHLISKIYFPRLIFPISKTINGFVEFVISLGLMLLLMLILGVYPGWSLLAFPVFLVLNIIVGLSIGIWLSALTIRYRDFHHLIPYLVSFGIWLTPVFYPTTLIPERFGFLMHFNPVAGVIAGYRWTLLGAEAPDLQYIYGFIPVLILFVSGVFYFRKIENDIADWI